MRGHVAVPTSPFYGGFRKAYAVFTGRKLLNLLATFAIANYLMTGAPVKLTPIPVHKETFNTSLYACTNHGYHTLSK
jgi:hypothetical protein